MTHPNWPRPEEHTLRPVFRGLAGVIAVLSLPTMIFGAGDLLGVFDADLDEMAGTFALSGVFGIVIFGTAAVRGSVPDWLLRFVLTLGVSADLPAKQVAPPSEEAEGETAEARKIAELTKQLEERDAQIAELRQQDTPAGAE